MNRAGAGGRAAKRRPAAARSGGRRRGAAAQPAVGAAAFHRIPNSAVAQALGEVADILEIEGESAFRVRAYRSAAQYLSNLGRPVAEIAAEGGKKALVELPSVGASIADKILEILSTGRLGKLRELRREVPPELSGLLAIPGLGPKKLHLLHERLGVRRLDDLERALASGEAAALPGFGSRSAAKLRDAVAQYRRRVGRFRLVEAEQYAAALCDHLRESGTVERLEVAGSFRRRRETVGDLDLLAVAADPQAATAALARFEGVAEVLLAGPTKTSVRLDNGLQIDLRIIPAATFGAALHYFTGSKEHNIALRTLAKQRGYKVSEYGGFRGRRRVAGRTEEEIFALVGARWIPPELRENRGEIEAAIAGALPALIEIGDLRGDLQMHTTATDGRHTAERMARAAAALGREYIAITEHSHAVRVAGGLDDAALLARCRELRRLRVPGVRVLTGVEVDILRDGALDLRDDTLAQLDVVVASVHSYLGLPRAEMTRRVIRAVESGSVHVLGHPTGRLINEREPIALDLEAVIRACARAGVALEINAHPSRLDLSDVHARLAKELGAALVISTDAHSTEELSLLRFGVDVARRAWLTPSDVLNTLRAEELLAALHGERRSRPRRRPSRAA